MHRTIKRINVGDSQVRVVVRLEADQCMPKSHEAFVVLVTTMQMIVGMPALLSGDMPAPDKVTFEHDGTRWVVEASALVERDPNGKAT